jgi:hypothetical protein
MNVMATVTNSETNSAVAVSSVTPLQVAVAAYIGRYGLRAFMDEDYNLTGTRVRAVVTEENLPLALALGVPVPDGELPVAIEKKVNLAAIEGARREANRAELARFFADPTNIPELSLGQRMFLEWHYLAPNNYSFTLEKSWQDIPGAARILGWNQETQLNQETQGQEQRDFRFYTGLLGCTGVCAIATDGSVYMSHWDKVCNPLQVEGYARFAASHPAARCMWWVHSPGNSRPRCVRATRSSPSSTTLRRSISSARIPSASRGRVAGSRYRFMKPK